MPQDSFANDSNAFIQWLSHTPGTRISSRIGLEDFRSRGAGRGVVAHSDIAEDEEVFAIPRRAILSVHNSELQSRLPTPLKPLGTWLSLIVVMIYEYLQGEKSYWHSYFSVLPRHFNTLMFWSESELAELQGSAVLQRIGKKDAEDSVLREIKPIIHEYPWIFPSSHVSVQEWDSPQGHDALLELAHKMGSLIMAYAFDIEVDAEDDDDADSKQDSLVTDDEDDPPKGMVPLADMLNANADLNNARLFHEEDLLIMKAMKPIKAGEEIFNDYGPLPRSDLLRRYGYASDRYTQYDVVEFSLQSIRDAVGDANMYDKLQYLDDLDLVEDGYSVGRPGAEMTLPDAVPSDMKTVLTTLLSPGPMKNKKPPKTRFGLPEARLLEDLISKRAAEYGTEITEDETALNALKKAANTHAHPQQTRLKMAIEVRLGEKQILQSLSELVHSFIRDNSQPNKRSGDIVDFKEMKKSRVS